MQLCSALYAPEPPRCYTFSVIDQHVMLFCYFLLQPPPMALDTPQYPDLRVSTITPANMQLLQQSGAWRELQQVAPTFQHMQVRD
jgi:hypothetical protein